MKILPWERLTLDSPLSVAEVRTILAQSIRPMAGGPFGLAGNRLVRAALAQSSSPRDGDDGANPYVTLEGSVSGDTFSAHVPIDYRNSFLPYARGKLVPLPAGTRMEVTISLHPAVMAFLGVWMSFVGMFCLAATVPGIFARPFQPMCLIPLGMLVLCPVVTLGAYHHELARTREAVRGLLPESPPAYR